MDTLTDQQLAILDVERKFWKTAGAKEEAIRQMGLTPIRYYQLLVQLIASPAAAAHDPLTVHRLQRIAAAKR